MVVADDTGRVLYQTPALHDCLDRAASQERSQLQGELDQAVRRLTTRVRTLDSSRPPAKAVVLEREVFTARSEFRVRGVLVPPRLLLADHWAVLVWSDWGNERSGCPTSATGWDSPPARLKSLR
jgi:hypothetical protein